MVRRTIANPIGFAQFLALSDDVGGLGGASQGGIAIAFSDLLRMLADLGVEYAVFGAFAVAAYVSERRSTLDIDVVASPQFEARIREAAARYDLHEQSREDAVDIRTFVHRSGVRVDIIFDARGASADLRAARQVELAGLGVVPVADIFDVAWAKLRTQNRAWPRDPAKRATDYADLVALLRSDSTLAPRLYERVTGMWELPRGERWTNAEEILQRVCNDAEVPYPEGKSSIPAWVGAMILVALLGIAYVASRYM